MRKKGPCSTVFLLAVVYLYHLLHAETKVLYHAVDIGSNSTVMDGEADLRIYSWYTWNTDSGSIRYSNITLVNLLHDINLFDPCSLDNYTPEKVRPLLRHFRVAEGDPWLLVLRGDLGLYFCPLHNKPGPSPAFSYNPQRLWHALQSLGSTVIMSLYDFNKSYRDPPSFLRLPYSDWSAHTVDGNLLTTPVIYPYPYSYSKPSLLNEFIYSSRYKNLSVFLSFQNDFDEWAVLIDPLGPYRIVGYIMSAVCFLLSLYALLLAVEKVVLLWRTGVNHFMMIVILTCEAAAIATRAVMFLQIPGSGPLFNLYEICILVAMPFSIRLISDYLTLVLWAEAYLATSAAINMQRYIPRFARNRWYKLAVIVFIVVVNAFAIAAGATMLQVTRVKADLVQSFLKTNPILWLAVSVGMGYCVILIMQMRMFHRMRQLRALLMAEIQGPSSKASTQAPSSAVGKKTEVENRRPLKDLVSKINRKFDRFAMHLMRNAIVLIVYLCLIGPFLLVIQPISMSPTHWMIGVTILMATPAIFTVNLIRCMVTFSESGDKKTAPSPS